MTTTINGPGGSTPQPAGVPEQSFEELARAVDAAAAAVAALDPVARAAAETLRSAIEEAHRAALVTMVRRLRADESGREVLFELVDDPLVHLLFSLHGIIRPDPLSQARRVLDSVRPSLQSHGGDVELVTIEDGTAFVRLSGACKGCSMSSVTMRTTVEEALVAGVPSVRSVEIVASEPGPAVIPLSEVRLRPQTPQEAHAAGWVKALTVDAVAEGEVTPAHLTSAAGVVQDVIVVRLEGSMTAYVDRCAHQGLPLGDALLDTEAQTLTCPWHGFCYDALSGECMSAPGVALEQLPLRVDGPDVWIRVGP